jgi:hypothetical protein
MADLPIAAKWDTLASVIFRWATTIELASTFPLKGVFVSPFGFGQPTTRQRGFYTMQKFWALGSGVLLTALLVQPVFAASPPGFPGSSSVVPADEIEEGPPALPGAITLGSTYLALPVAIAAGTSLDRSGTLPMFTGLIGLPVAMGAGHIHAGDPVRGIGLGLLTYPVILGSLYASSFLIPRIPPTPGSWSGLGDLINFAVVAVGSGVVYSLFVAGDAVQTPLRLQAEQNKKITPSE